jgi:hypothetical protein
MLLNVGPRNPSLDRVDIGSGAADRDSNIAVPLSGANHALDRPDLFNRQNCPRMRFAFWHSALRRRVLLVIGNGPNEQVVGVDARRHVALMANRQATGDRADVQFIGVPMRSEMSVSDREYAVAEASLGAGPQPASVGVGFVHESPESRKGTTISLRVPASRRAVPLFRGGETVKRLAASNADTVYLGRIWLRHLRSSLQDWGCATARSVHALPGFSLPNSTVTRRS